MNKTIKYTLACMVSVFALSNACITAGSEGQFSSAQWFFNARTNVNSAAMIAGVAATWHAAYYGALPALKAGYQYARGNKSQASEILTKVKGNLSTSVFMAGLALALEGFNKYYLREQFYAKMSK